MAFTDRLHNRGSISTGYDIDNSCKFEADNQEEFIRTPSSASNQKTWTVSMWFKRTEINNYQMLFGCLDTYCYFDTSNNLSINFRGASENFFLITNRLFRDTSAWYHIVVVCDFTNSTAADRGRLYINGVRETSYSNSTYQNAHSGVNSSWNSGSAMAVGGQNGSTTFQSCGYMAEVHGVDGSALTADSFGVFDDTGIWKPKEADVTYGTNGFYFKFDSPSDMGNDSSGNNNDFSVVNINQNDQATDTPTNNFATGNAITPFSTSTTVSEGATKIAKGANGWELLSSTIAVTKGKWYVEVRNETVAESSFAFIIPADSTQLSLGGQTTNYPASAAGDGGVAYYAYNDEKYIEGTWSTYGSGNWRGSTNTIGIALDMDNGYVYFAKDNTWQASGNPTSGSSGTNGIAIPDYTTKPYMIGYSIYAANNSGFINFGGYTGAAISSAASDADGYGTFEYAPPTGYYALCTKNLAEYG